MTLSEIRPRRARVSWRPAAFAILALMLVQASVLYGMGRLWICACGTIRLWVGDIWSDEMSQQITDWYTFSHIVHGFLFYGLLHLVSARTPVLTRLAVAVGIEAAWEIAENTPWVIEAYRQQALARGYVGDSILNSLMDTVSMMTGFTLAYLLPWRVTVALALVMEIAVGWLVHDNLTLNILNFIHRFPAIEAWQSSVK
ncbi:Protein of unknown function [Enhydrobacter aerosaccus]|uniref:Uncharacterized protein n=1 Tax=Enhydrobacter aerosaccus TaxID=225324 RepID=A0A1T4SPY7_9HYPH|nr:DUF2585 family protein [Enhydrobacter aerosaccus]SKA30354.1 Protein of unknown function [Enhydrobacter aerosaccus]